MDFKEKLSAGTFLVTADIIPPRGIGITEAVDPLSQLKGRVDAVNAPDMPGAKVKASSLATCMHIKEMGLEPIMQITCRDRNRLGLQSDLLGASMLGIENILIMTGDKIELSDHQEARGVFDLDSVELLRVARGLENGHDMVGNALEGSPRFCLGAVVNPCNADNMEREIERMQQKMASGAEFFQTQPVFDPGAFINFLEESGNIKVPVLAGILLLKSARMARFVNENVPGIEVPAPIIDSLESSSDPQITSLDIAAEIIKALRGNCAGVHIMTIKWEEKIPQVLDKVGL